ncbi:MAG TPA: amidohydrolase family protein [Clostridia bacterium]|nr:amidohydrolase family protein [Clostridia bacterium]
MSNNIAEYKIIDIHDHIFPDKIAEKAVAAIGRYYGIKMRHTGTVGTLLEAGHRIGTTNYVVHSSATTVEQVQAINDYICGVQVEHPEFIGFATLHPGLSDIGREVDRIISMGLHGIKLHPEFQNLTLDEDYMMPLYEAVEGRLPVLIHIGDRNRDSSSPKRLSRVLDAFPGLVVIAAHLGGYSVWDQSEYLIGKNLYIDTSSSLPFMEPSRAVGIIRRHGVNKVLFGTDYPMWDHAEELERFMRLDLTEDERKAILHGNAHRLLFGGVKKASDI